MKRIAILISIFLLCSVNTYAKEKEKLVRMNFNSGSEFYRTADYQHREGSIYSISVEERYTEKSRTRISGAAYTRTKYLIDCKKTLYRVSLKMHVNPQGQFMGGGSTPHFRFTTIHPGTIEDSLYRFICLS